MNRRAGGGFALCTWSGCGHLSIESTHFSNLVGHSLMFIPMFMFDIIPCGRNMVHDEFHRCDSRAKGMSLCDSSSAHSLQCLIFSAIWPLPPQAIGDSSRKKGQEFKGKRVGYCLALLILRVFLANELALLRRGSASSVGIHDCDCAGHAR